MRLSSQSLVGKLSGPVTYKDIPAESVRWKTTEEICLGFLLTFVIIAVVLRKRCVMTADESITRTVVITTISLNRTVDEQTSEEWKNRFLFLYQTEY